MTARSPTMVTLYDTGFGCLFVCLFCFVLFGWLVVFCFCLFLFCFCFLFWVFFFAFPSYISEVHHFWVRFLRM